MENKIRKPFVWEALLSFSFLVVCMVVGIIVFEQAPHMPMLLGTAFAAVIAIRLGYSWKEIEKSMFDGIMQAMQAIIILAIIGILIGVWIQAGVVPTMIYYGLKILSPKIFLIACIIIASVTSLATGTSWGTMGTVGVALIGVATGLGIPLPITAGAIISGAYFGDKMSPLSDTTNLAPAMAGTDVFTHVKFMIKPTLLSYVITIIAFGFIGMKYAGGSADLSQVELISSEIAKNFTISPVLLIPPVTVIFLISRKVPAIPGIFAGIILGAVLGMIFQDATFGDFIKVGYDGYTRETGVAVVDDLLKKGGLQQMFFSISLTIFAMMFGGIMEKTGQLEVIVEKLVALVKSPRGLLGLTMFTCLISNATMPEQYISLVLPGRMYAQTYRERGLHPKMLSNALESSGTILSPLIPWNTCGAFMSDVSGIDTLSYAPWAIFNIITPFVVFLLSIPGTTIATIESDPDTVVQL